MNHSRCDDRLSYSDSPYWKYIGVRRIFTCGLSIVLNTSHALAEPLDTYCIMQGGQGQDLSLSPAMEQSTQATFSVGSVLFYVMADGDQIRLKRQGDTIPLAELTAPQYEFGRINSLALGENDWLWIDGDEIDYTVLLNHEQSLPTIGLPIALPELYTEPCSLWNRFWNHCTRAQGVYSTTLNRPFITGHQVTFLGQPDLVSFEIISGEAKLLPEKASSARFVVDVPKLAGALFQGNSGEGLFYNGTVVTTLWPISSNQTISDTEPKWYVESTYAGRTFITNAGLGKHPPFLEEIKAGPILTSISIPDELANRWLSLFTLPNDPRLWGVTRHTVLTEVGTGLRTIIVVPEPYFIEGPAGLWQTSNGMLTFSVKNIITGAAISYSLVRASPTVECRATLNIDKPIFLGND